MVRVGGGWAYKLADETFSPMSSVGAPTDLNQFSAAFVGGKMVAAAPMSLRVYDPTSDVWTSVGSLHSFENVVVPADQRAFVYGDWGELQGFDVPSMSLFSIAPSPFMQSNYPSTRAVWSGTSFLLWDARMGRGNAYNASTNTWTPLPFDGPRNCDSQSGTWLGDRMILWGGLSGGAPNNLGAAYIPAADKWSAMSTVNAPSARLGHVAVSDGSRLYIFGGSDCMSGGAYDPATDSWSPMDFSQGPCFSATDPIFSTALAFWFGGKLYVTERADELWVYSPAL